MRKKLGSLLLAVSLSMSMVASPFADYNLNVAYADEEDSLTMAQLKADGTILVILTHNYKEKTDIKSLCKLTDENGNEVAITDATGGTPSGKRALITVEGNMEFGHTYTLSIEGYKAPVTVDISGLFSTDAFEEAFTYDGDDLGANYSKDKTEFKCWSPTASSIKVNLYTSGDKSADDLIQSYDMTKGEKGVWSVEVEGDLNGTYYTYSPTNDGTERETQDPYGKAVGINGDRSMVVDLDSTDPDGWDKDERHLVNNMTDAILYELHVRDFSMGDQSGISDANKGKYLAFTESGTKTSAGTATGMDHIEDLGVNMVHILPSYDFGSVDEKVGGFNWGYDPKNYQVPEGSYSTDATNGAVRINEYKQMIKAFHDRGIGVVQDCVYNHTHNTGFAYNILAYGYFYRANSNGSGCGNDTASERSMVRKYIVDSVKYWAEEYHMDGFRFDLMGLHDVDTMMAVREMLDTIDPHILVYGEGWTMGTSVTKDVLMATQKNCSATTGIAYFSDGIRDYVINASFGSGGVRPGYANGADTATAEGLKNYVQGRYTSNAKDEATNPTQVVNYITCHDGYTLWDKINKSNPDDSDEDKIAQAKLAEAIILTSQGIPFILSGDEFLRTKKMVDNSYNKGDDINALCYEQMEQYPQMYEYVKGLIEFRKNHAALRYTTFEEMDKTYTWISDSQDLGSQVLAYTIDGGENGEVADSLLIAYNPTSAEVRLTLPEGDWNVCVNGEKAGVDTIETVSGELTLTARSCFALVKGETKAASTDLSAPSSTSSSDSSSSSSSSDTTTKDDKKSVLPLVIVLVIVIVVVGGISFVANKKRQ